MNSHRTRPPPAAGNAAIRQDGVDSDGGGESFIGGFLKGAMMAGIGNGPESPVHGFSRASPIVRQTGMCESRVEVRTTGGDQNMQTDILSQWRRHAREQRDAIAFVAPHRNWTYGELDTESNRIAQGLLALGIGPGERVAALTKHTAECLALMISANKVGAVCMPVNWRLAPPEITYILENGQARLLMRDTEFTDACAQLSIPSLVQVVGTLEAAGAQPGLLEWAAGFPATDTGREASPRDTALQLYSSG